jgi:very-short-patch-repair endonuclease
MPKNPIILYNPKLKQLARELRNNPTYSEKILWQGLRRKQLGCEFHRQVPIDEYIIDFYCHELRLAIEIDGISHDSLFAKRRDVKRQQILENLGVKFLRFTDDEVLENPNKVIGEIEEWVKEHGTSP